jgi:hypothetical protein
MRTLQQHLADGAASSGSGPTFSLAYDSSSKPGRISSTTGKPMPPGADFVSKAASKNAKKRANKKAKAGGAEEGGDDDEQQPAPSSSGNSQAAAVEAVAQQVRGAQGAACLQSLGGSCCYCS